MYKPEPINTDGIELPSEINALTEKIAASTHDVWAQNKIAQGFKYGEATDNKQRRTEI